MLLCVLAAPSPIAAQEVIGISAILSTTNSTHIDTYSATEMDAVTAYYYDAYVEGYLFQNNGLVADGAALGNPTASGTLTEPLAVGDTYEIDSYHYLVAFFVYSDGGNEYYYNPYDFAFDGGEGDPSGTGFFGGGGETYETAEYIYLGYTYVVLPTGVPSISSINPTSASVGSSGTITAQGTNLEDLFTQSTTPAVDGSGVTLTVQSAAPTQVALGFSIAQNASTGAHHLTLATRFGTSNAVAFNVGDPTPIVTGISPNAWQAGDTYSVTVTGKGFGTSPTVSVSGTGVSVGTVSNTSDTQLTVGISVSPNAPSETVTLTVQSNGYNGSGFISTTPGESSTGSNTAQVNPLAPPVPYFVMGADSNGALCNSGTPLSGTQQVYAGQQIMLTACIPQSSLSVISAGWSTPAAPPLVPLPTLAGFSVTNVSGTNPQYAETLTEVQPTNCSTSSYCDLAPFYWVAMGSQTVEFAYTAGNLISNSASVTFNVLGPTGSLLLQPTMAPNNSGVQVVSSWNLSTCCVAAPGGAVGIAFKSNATLPSATETPSPGTNQAFLWTQLITSIQNMYMVASGVYTTPQTPGSGLDNSYPYAYFSLDPTMTVDTPSAGLPNSTTYGEGWESFTATMYLMWDPALPSGCQPAKTVESVSDGTLIFTSTVSTCTSIPVPLSSVTWHWSGCAINTLVRQSNSTTWTLSTSNGCPVETPGTPQSGPLNSYPYGYPVWGNVWPPS
jgi:hypothetical protein